MKFILKVISVFCLAWIGFVLFKQHSDREIHPGVLTKNVSIPSSDCCFDSKIFAQKFYFLGHGEQSCCFRSEDGQYVLKFFLNTPLPNSRKYFKRLSFQAFKNFRNRHTQKIMTNYQNLYEKNPALAGLIGVHLNIQRKDLPHVSLQNVQGKVFDIDLNQYPFILQKRATRLLESLANCKSEEQRKEILLKVHTFFKIRTDFGFTDNKRLLSLNRNYGFIDGSLVQFDAGSLQFREDVLKFPEKEFSLVEKKFLSWIHQKKYFSDESYQNFIDDFRSF